MTYIEVGKFFLLNGEDGLVLSVRCVCNSNLLRIGKAGKATCSKCGVVYVAPTDRAGLAIVNSKSMLEYFFEYDAVKLPRDRTR
jgi:hypothetical protein